MRIIYERHVIFGTGPVGLTLADELISRGKRVTIVNRSGRGTVPAGAELIAADMNDPGTAEQLCQGASAVYHCMNVPYTQQYDVIPRLQKILIEAAGKAGAKLIVTDSLYMYGPTNGAVMTEDTPYAATSRKGKMRAQVATDYLKAHQDGKVRVALGRAADFYGPRVNNSSFGDRVFPAAIMGKSIQVVGNIDLPHAYSYIKDVARGLATLAETDKALGRAWLLPVAPAISTREMITIIGTTLGAKTRTMVLPKLGIQAMGLFDSEVKEFVEMFYQYMEPQIVDSSQFETAFGCHATPITQAIAETVAWFLENR